MMIRLLAAAAAVSLAGCGSDANTITPAPAMKEVNATPVDDYQLGVDGVRKDGGENPFGPKRADADKKIAEIRGNASLSDDLKKQLIDEVERTYKNAQSGAKRN